MGWGFLVRGDNDSGAGLRYVAYVIDGVGNLVEPLVELFA